MYCTQSPIMIMRLVTSPLTVIHITASAILAGSHIQTRTRYQDLSPFSESIMSKMLVLAAVCSVQAHSIKINNYITVINNSYLLISYSVI